MRLTSMIWILAVELPGDLFEHVLVAVEPADAGTTGFHLRRLLLAVAQVTVSAPPRSPPERYLMNGWRLLQRRFRGPPPLPSSEGRLYLPQISLSLVYTTLACSFTCAYNVYSYSVSLVLSLCCCCCALPLGVCMGV